MLFLNIHRSVLISYSAEQMYNLVNDIESYPKFIPGCIGVQVLKSTVKRIVATINFSTAGISQTFTSYNVLTRNKNVLIHLVGGSFKTFIGEWRFLPIKRKICYVELYLDFELTNKLVKHSFECFSKKIITNMVQIFIVRAQEVYGVV